ncbi:MAG: ribosome recycling factor [Alphaproteobacteria bacterium GM7ARS4]|nr:ribosome recycling factor [Alphaproteobacteria bacterium GM7ARS4]
MLEQENIDERMRKTQDVLRHAFSGIRTGRASIAMLDPIIVDAYGQKMPLNQLSSVAVADARLLTVQVWDKSMVEAVEKAIRESDLGLNPMRDGQLIRLNVPPLSMERRKELTRLAAKYAEQARISIRNVRRDVLESIKKQQKDGDVSEDDMHKASEEVQKITDKYIEEVNDSLTRKEHEITQS